ncbi:Yippee-like protein [Metarhizium robertsii ARSEF 23]|uniref:Yippee-like protein n=1 Tax=Metarhizium robertsii (strain ARSEF 23 / ATCC MYA-3075) TaxID=655844 RepID=A0A0B2XF77_METRA|nr:Yippee-like protein [Metarhizium robertsii ARSEF 23]KHO10669.1 Yippee-like protein [Metarhizium robertsii ARSEF 23]
MDWKVTTILQLAFSVFVFLFLLSSLFIAAFGRKDARKSTRLRACTLLYAIAAAVTSHFWSRANGQLESETQLISTLTIWNSAASFAAWPLTSESSRCSGVAVVAITVTTIVFGRFHSSLACVVAVCGSNVLVLSGIVLFQLHHARREQLEIYGGICLLFIVYFVWFAALALAEGSDTLARYLVKKIITTPSPADAVADLVKIWYTTCVPTVALSCYASLRILALNVVKYGGKISTAALPWRKMLQHGLVSDPEAPSVTPGHRSSMSESLQGSGTQLQQFRPLQNPRPPSAGSKLTTPSSHGPAAVPAGPLDPSPTKSLRE